MPFFAAPDAPETADEIVYLAGPVQGTKHWQDDAARIFEEIAPAIPVVSPRRSQAIDPIKQIEWETTQIERAARSGVILFWFAKPAHSARQDPYHHALFELGEWAARSRYGAARIIMGIEKGVPGATYLRRRLSVSYPNIPVCGNLRQACVATTERIAAQSGTTQTSTDLLKGWEEVVRARLGFSYHG